MIRANIRSKRSVVRYGAAAGLKNRIKPDKPALRGKSMISRSSTVLLLLVLSVGAVSPAPITSDEVRVIDGDTIRLNHQRPDVRLVGLNAPETRRAICEAERELGDKATRRLRDLVQSSKLEL
jgi:endonuclease YncB( thermonuclease family)